MKKTVTTIRCVPRLGLGETQFRIVELDLYDDADEQQLFDALTAWFANRGIADAVYDINLDDEGFLAVINDEVYDRSWGVILD